MAERFVDRLLEYDPHPPGRAYISALMARSDSLSQQVGQALRVLAEERGRQLV